MPSQKLSQEQLDLRSVYIIFSGPDEPKTIWLLYLVKKMPKGGYELDEFKSWNYKGNTYWTAVDKATKEVDVNKLRTNPEIRLHSACKVNKHALSHKRKDYGELSVAMTSALELSDVECLRRLGNAPSPFDSSSLLKVRLDEWLERVNKILGLDLELEGLAEKVIKCGNDADPGSVFPIWSLPKKKAAHCIVS